MTDREVANRHIEAARFAVEEIEPLFTDDYEFRDGQIAGFVDAQP